MRRPLIAFTPGQPLRNAHSHHGHRLVHACKRRPAVLAVSPSSSPSDKASTSAPVLSARAEDLISRYRERPLFRVSSASATSAALSERVSAAQRDGLFLCATDIPDVEQQTAAEAIASSADGLVQSAKEQVLLQFPGITDASKGGALSGPGRAETCWRDLRLFVTVAQYCVAADVDANSGVDTEGTKILKELYEELSVPIPAMRAALRHLADESQRNGLHRHARDVYEKLCGALS